MGCGWAHVLERLDRDMFPRGFGCPWLKAAQLRNHWGIWYRECSGLQPSHAATRQDKFGAYIAHQQAANLH